MTVALDRITRPAPNADYRVDTGHRKVGLAVAVIGLVIAAVVVGLAIAAGVQVGDAGEEDTVRELLVVAFGLNTVALVTIKIGIAVILVGILVRLWLRVESIKASLPALKPQAENVDTVTGSIETPYGAAKATATVPSELPIHKMARTLWAPMLVMGAMLVVAGFIVALFWAADVGSDPEGALDLAAWTQGLQFLGEGFVLAGISFLLGSILGGLRSGGGSVQEALGLPVKTLEMPTMAKVFIGLMVVGVMVAIAQFVLYLVTTGFDDPADVATWFAWLGPLRELGLGLLLAGIVMALAAIGTVLGFQFWRIRDIVATGR